VSKTYLIVPMTKVTALAGRAGIVQKRVEDLRKNVDGTKAIVKYSGAKPAVLVNYEAANGPVPSYTHAEILIEMVKPEWGPATERPAVQVATTFASAAFVQRHKWKVAGAITAAAAAAAGAAYWYFA
jgi:hypothetical protein